MLELSVAQAGIRGKACFACLWSEQARQDLLAVGATDYSLKTPFRGSILSRVELSGVGRRPFGIPVLQSRPPTRSSGTQYRGNAEAEDLLEIMEAKGYVAVAIPHYGLGPKPKP